MSQSDIFHNLQREIRNLVQSETIYSSSFFLKRRAALYMTSVGFDPFVQRGAGKVTESLTGDRIPFRNRKKP